MGKDTDKDWRIVWFAAHNRRDWYSSMTTTLFTQINYTLATLLDQIKLGQIGLPEIQRRNLRTHSQVGNADAGRLSSNGVIPGPSYMAPVR